MRLLYSCHDSFPSSDTNTQQIFWTVLEVTRQGVEVELTIPSLTVEGSRDVRADLAAYYGAAPDLVPPAFTIRPLGTTPTASPLAKAWFDWRVPASLKGRSADLIWTRDPVAAASCVRAGLPTVFETYRPDFASRARFGAWRRACLRNRHLAGLVLHSHVAADAFVAAGVPRERCLVAHNGFAPSLMEPRLDRAQARARLGLPADDRLVVYAGHVGRKKGTAALVRMAAAAPDARILLLGVQPGSVEARRIDAVARSLGAGNLILRPRVPLSEVAAYLYAADCLVVPPTDEPLTRFGRTVLPMKIFMYLAAGRPILAPRLPDIEEVLTDRHTACLVSAHDPQAAAAVLVRLLADHRLQDHLSRHALAAAGQYTWAARAGRLLEFFERIHDAGRPVVAG